MRHYEDPLNEYVKKMRRCRRHYYRLAGVFQQCDSRVKAFIDRAGLVARANDNMLQKKVGAPVVVVSRAGATFAFAAINFFFLIQQMIIPGSVTGMWASGASRGRSKTIRRALQL